MKISVVLSILLAGFISFGCKNEVKKEISDPVAPPHIVFIAADEEYRSEESMPMLAKITRRELGARVSMCFSVDSAGFVDPNRLDHISGLKALESADLMIMFTRFRELPESELQYIVEYVESGKPIIGFRTSTHAFLYKKDSTLIKMNNEWPQKVFGQQWITHHGHFDDGQQPLTRVEGIDGNLSHILKGVNNFDAYSWLYHVDGGEWKLAGDSQPLLMGHSLKSYHEMEGNLDKFPKSNPVAWTKSYTGKNGLPSRVFFTTLGHPYDWKDENMRRLALNAIYWALEKEIPVDTDVSIVDSYEPNNSGFGLKYKTGLRPEDLWNSEE